MINIKYTHCVISSPHLRPFNSMLYLRRGKHCVSLNTVDMKSLCNRRTTDNIIINIISGTPIKV
jgi:hypothetical protein